MYLLNYECVSSAGFGTDAFMYSLYNKKDNSTVIQQDVYNHKVVPGGKVCFIPGQDLKNRNYKKTFSFYFESVFNMLVEKHDFSDIKKDKILCILSSTKGIVEDYIWGNSSNSNPAEKNNFMPDPFESLNDDIFLTFEKNGFKKENLKILSVSQACSSSHVSVELASHYLDSNEYDYVFVVCFDFIGPFIYSGFNSLKVLSTTINQPFANCRDGLQLGEALAILVLTNKKLENNKCAISGLSSLVKPASITRPTLDGSCLVSVLEKSVDKNNLPDFYVAHGTGTQFNDSTEDIGIYTFQNKLKLNNPLTSTKWSIGHCLGASGAMDIIAASEVLNLKKIFSIGTTEEIDLKFKNKYLLSKNHNDNNCDIKLNTAMITSLGFGGIHAAITLSKESGCV